MKQYKIYANPQGAYEAVKQGWSWPGFFFNIIWVLVKKMWALGGILIAVFFTLGIIAAAVGGDAEQAVDGIANLASIIIAIVFGINGNRWRENNLQTKGYEFKDTVNAVNPEGAVFLYRYVKESSKV